MSLSHTLLLNLVRSTQILIIPLGLGTTTIAEHHSVGSWTFDIMPILSIQSSSSLTLGRSGTATLLGVDNAKGVTLSFNLIEYLPLNLPNPLNSSGYWSGMLSSTERACNVESSFSEIIAGFPTSGFDSPSLTYICSSDLRSSFSIFNSFFGFSRASSLFGWYSSVGTTVTTAAPESILNSKNSIHF